jgi:hypothetical protein
MPPQKKAAPAKKAAPVKQAAPVRKAAAKKAAPVEKAAPAPPAAAVQLPPPEPAEPVVVAPPTGPGLAAPVTGWAALATPEPRDRNVPALVTVGAAAIVLVGSLLPWATARTVLGDVSINGTEGDGVLTLILALVAGAITVAVIVGKRPGMWAYVVLLIAAVLTAFIGVYDLVDVSRTVGDDYAHISTGAGLWLVALASLVLLGGGVQLTRSRSRAY